MAKLGYTWYPKDWNNSEKVFELTLVERGLYRELIDMAMLNDNKTVVNVKVWARKFGSSIEEIEGILIILVDLKLIELVGDMVFIPSCESRLSLVRAGAKGGSKSKPKPKPIESLDESLLEALPEAYDEPKEKKRKEIENKGNETSTKVEKIDFDILLKFICDTTERQYRTINAKVRQSFNARMKEGYTKVDIMNAIKNASKNQFHLDNGRQYLTPEFFSRSATLEKFSSVAKPVPQFDPNANPVN